MDLKTIKTTIYVFLLSILSVTVNAQSNEGREFWFGFMEHVDVFDNAKVAMITSKSNTNGTISIPNRSWSADFNVNADDVTIVTLPNFTENIGSESFDNTGVQVVANDPVSVYVHQYHTFRSEASVVLPVSSLGSSYFVLTYNGVVNRGNIYPSEFLIVGVNNDTKISIELGDNTLGGNSEGSILEIELNRGETYQIQAAEGTGDLSGSKLTGDKNFALFSGNSWTEVPTGCEARDNLLEQMYALDKWGKKIVTVPSANVNYDIFRIMASEDNTTLTISGSNGVEETISMQSGDFVEKRYSEAKFIEADRPIQVAQFLIGSSCGGHPVGDPSMVMLNSVTQTRDTVTLYNSSLQNIEENYINIIAFTSDIPLITLDGFALPTTAEIRTVDIDGEYSYVRVEVNRGAHTIISEGCGVIATAYGYGEAESYAYSGGASFNAININPIPDGGCLNDTVFFDANLPETRYSFLWDLGDDITFNSKSFEVFYDELGSYPTQLYVLDECAGTVDTFTKDIQITLRQAVEASGDTVLCKEGTFQLGATDVEAADFLWTGPNNFISEEQFPSITDAKEVMSGQYAVVGIVSGCATFPSYANVEVLPLPSPNFNRDSIYCNRREEIVLLPGEFVEYIWHDGSSVSEYVVGGEGSYSVTVTGENGCQEAEQMNLRQRCPTELYMPNIFSPNDDGFNDVWMVYGHDITSFDLQIRNRWGELVFISQDQDRFWNGKVHGRPAASDVYLYTLHVEGYTADGGLFKETITGSITLVR